MEYNLKIKERLLVETIFDKETNRRILRLQQDILNKIEITTKEFEAINFVQNENGGCSWNLQNDLGKSINFEITEIEYIKECLFKIDSQNKLSKDLILLYDTFINS